MVECLTEEMGGHVCLGQRLSIGTMLVPPNRGKLCQGAVATKTLVTREIDCNKLISNNTV